MTLTAKEGYAFHLALPEGSSPPTTTFQVRLPLTTYVGGGVLELGTMRAELTDPTLHSVKNLDDGSVVFVVETKDRTIRYLPDLAEGGSQDHLS